MSALSSHADDWNELAEFDPLWAVLTHEDKLGNLWKLDEFWTTGEQQVAATMDRLTGLGWQGARGDVLDFGCGVGRMARALAGYFDRVTGVDISEKMTEIAGDLCADVPNVSFVVNPDDSLDLFEDNSFDCVHTFLVLQHMPSPEIALSYIYEFARILRPGGVLVFDMPTAAPRLHALRAKRLLYRSLRRLGKQPADLHRRGLTPMTMTSLPRAAIDTFVHATHLETLLVEDRTAGALTKTFWYLRKP